MADADAPERPARPLFRPEALGEPEYGEALAFTVPPWRAIGLVLLAAILLFLAFGTLANFDRVAQARGTVVPESGVARIAAPQSGTVSAVLVRRGQQVVRGAPILQIASPDRLPSGAAAKAEALATFRRQQELSRSASAVGRSRYRAERSRLAEQAAELRAAASSLHSRIALQQERIRKNEERLRKLAPARAKGFVSEASILAIEDAVLTQRQQLGELRQQAANAAHELRRTELRTSELAADERKAQLEAQAALLALERGAVDAQIEAEVTLVASANGVVGALHVTAGSSVRPGQEVAAIVRPGDRLQVELHVPSTAAGSLYPGQEVALRYDAFPYRRYGVGHGTVEDVAATATLLPGSREPAYRVRVRLADADRFALRPDMTLSAVIKVEERSLIGWLFAPLREQWRERRR